MPFNTCPICSKKFFSIFDDASISSSSLSSSSAEAVEDEIPILLTSCCKQKICNLCKTAWEKISNRCPFCNFIHEEKENRIVDSTNLNIIPTEQQPYPNNNNTTIVTISNSNPEDIRDFSNLARAVTDESETNFNSESIVVVQRNENNFIRREKDFSNVLCVCVSLGFSSLTALSLFLLVSSFS